MTSSHDHPNNFSQLDNETLLSIITSKRADYTRAELFAAEAVLRERGNLPKYSNMLLPLFVGVGLVILHFILVFRLPAGDGTVLAGKIIMGLITRAAIAYWMLKLARQYALPTSHWVTLAVFFGEWALIAMSFSIRNRRATPLMIVERA